MKIKSFHDKNTGTLTYIITDTSTNNCAVIDPVWDYDQFSGKISTESADKIIDYINSNKLTTQWLLETHVHADHLSSSNYLKSKLGGKIAIGYNIKKVIETWTAVFNTHNDTPKDGSQFDKLFSDDDTFKIGNLEVRVLHTPGHTPACSTYLIGDCAFVGDTIFMPYAGTARADFPGGSAHDLYNSIQRILSLPDSTKIYVCHDYPTEGAEAMYQTTVGEQKMNNIFINSTINEQEFIEKRQKRDATLSVPKLLYPSIQVNIRAGKFSQPEDNGITYLKIPLNKKS